MKMSQAVMGVALTLLLGSANGNNVDRFNYGSQNSRVGNGGTDYGQQSWSSVSCDNEGRCDGYPNFFEFGNGFSVDEDGNNCAYCPESGPQNCGLHRQSPIDLHRDRGIIGNVNEKSCPDWHWMAYRPDSCSWDDMATKDTFQIERHALQINIPTLPNGDIDCQRKRDGARRWPRLDYSKGFPDWWWMSRMDVTVPSQHHQEGKQYAAEVTLAHFYEIEHPKNQVGHVSLMMQDYPDAESWPFLDKLLCAWRAKEEEVRVSCGLPPAAPYGRCRLYRNQVPTEEWLEEAGLRESATTDPTSSPVSQPTSGPSAAPVTTSPSAAPTNEPTSAPVVAATSAPVPGIIFTPITAPSSGPTTSPVEARVTASPSKEPTNSFPGYEETSPPTSGPTTAPVAAIEAPPTASPSLSPTLAPTNAPTDAPIAAATAGPTNSPTNAPTDAPIVAVTAGPTDSPTSAPTNAPIVAATDSPTSAPIELARLPEIECGDYRVNFNRMCFSSDPCCDSQRSDTSFCWNLYDTIFPGDNIYAACSQCCVDNSNPTAAPKEIGPPNPPHPNGLEQSIQCSAVDNPFRMCKVNSCCSGSESGYCRELYNFWEDAYGPTAIDEICWYCCRDPQMIPERRNRGLRLGSNDTSTDTEMFTLPDQDVYDPPPIDSKITYVQGKKILLRPENFEVHEEEDEEYFDHMHSDYQRRTQETPLVHEEDYEDVKYWPYEWMLKVDTEYYYRYEGTQVVPPCWEIVHWRVMKDPIRVHARQIAELNRLLATRTDPDSCSKDTAGVVSPSGDTVNVSREISYYHPQHRKVFCECKDWPSKFQSDRDWCSGWKDDAEYKRFTDTPYNFDTNGEW